MALEGNGGRLSYWNGSVPTPVAPVPASVADQAHEFAIRLARLIHGEYIPHVSAASDSPNGIAPTPETRPAPGEGSSQTDNTDSESSDPDGLDDETCFTYPGHDSDSDRIYGSDSDLDPDGTAAFFQVRRDLPSRSGLGVTRYRGVPKVIGRKRTSTAVTSGDDRQTSTAQSPPTDGDLGEY